MSKTETPSIRFRGFGDAWEQRKLGEVSESYSGGTPSVGVKEYYGEQIPFIRSAEINSEITELFLTEEGLKNSSARLVAVGDILYALYGATSGEVGRARLKGAINQAILAIKPHTDYDSEYLAQWLRKSKHSIIETYLQGGQGNLSGTIVKELSVDFPSLKEQKAIGDFFRQLDNLITLHQRKFEKLTNVKKSMLEKMFPQNGSCYPAVRFKGFTSPWERRKFGDVFEEYSEKNRADLPPLTIIQGSGTIRRDESERALQYDKASLSNYKVVNEGDLIVHLRSFEGGLEKANSQGIISPAYHTFHGEGVDSRFYYTYFRSKNFIDIDLKPHVYGIRDGRSIDIEGMKTIEIPFTSYPEQKLIGDAIDSINTLISLQRRELEKLQSIKKSLLEKMFV